MAATALLNYRASRTLGLTLFGSIGLTTLAACSSFQQEAAAFQAGSRVATVTAVGNAADLKASGLTDCREIATKTQLDNARFASLSYRLVGARQHSHIVILDDQTIVAVGDTVYANIEKCGTPLQVR